MRSKSNTRPVSEIMIRQFYGSYSVRIEVEGSCDGSGFLGGYIVIRDYDENEPMMVLSGECLSLGAMGHLAKLASEMMCGEVAEMWEEMRQKLKAQRRL